MPTTEISLDGDLLTHFGHSKGKHSVTEYRSNYEPLIKDTIETKDKVQCSYIPNGEFPIVLNL